jgi:hypothetical protein
MSLLRLLSLNAKLARSWRFEFVTNLALGLLAGEMLDVAI